MKKVEKFCLELTLTLSFGRKYLYFVNMSYSIGDVVKKTGLSAYTLRYYEKEGLLPFVKKNASGMRAYSDEDLRWLTMIECLKDSGLQIKEMARLAVVMNKIRYKELLYREAVRVGSLDVATNERRLKHLKKKLFESPDDFDK